MGAAWIPEQPGVRVVLVTASEPLRAEAVRAAAAAGVALGTAQSVSEAMVLRPAVLLVGPDCRAGRVPAGTEVIVIGVPGQEAELWERAAALSAERVAVLPPAAAWLAGYLGRNSANAAGQVVGVLGAVGGSGASTFSALLAGAASHRGIPTLLVDGDGLGGGLDALAGTGDTEGIRWPDLADVRGLLNPVQLAEALPTVDGFSLLSWPDSVPAGATDQHLVVPAGVTGAIPPVMDAARTGFALTIADLGRAWTDESSLLPYCERLLLVVPGRPRAIAAARNIVRRLDPQSVSAVVRGPLAADLDPVLAAELAGCSFAGYFPAVRRLPAAENSGNLLDYCGDRTVRRVLHAVLGQVLAGQEAA